MYVEKRGKYYRYEFVFEGKPVKLTTSQSNKQLARQLGEAHRLGLIKGTMDRDGNKIGEKPPVPTLKEFIETRFDPWAKNTYGEKSANYVRWYRCNCRALAAYDPKGTPFASKPLDTITSEDVARFAGFRTSAGLKKTSVNRALGMLRRVLSVAVEWGVIVKAPRVQLLSGEEGRDRVVTEEEQAKYLAAAPPLLYDVEAILYETGMRPKECYSLRWEKIFWRLSRYGEIAVARDSTKTDAGERFLIMTPIVREILQARHSLAGEPVDGFVFPAKTLSGHISDSSLKRQRKAAFKAINESARKLGEKPLEPIIHYAARHTYLTRLGSSGCDPWTFMRVAGHSSMKMSLKYVHPDQETVHRAHERMEMAQGHPKSTPNREMGKKEPEGQKPLLN